MTNTELLVKRLIELSVVFDEGRLRDPRIQPKRTGCESRRALSTYSRFRGCYDDCNCTYEGRNYIGVDLMSPVKKIVAADTITIQGRKDTHDDNYLWVFVK